MTSCQPYQTNWNDAKITNISANLVNGVLQKVKI